MSTTVSNSETTKGQLFTSIGAQFQKDIKTSSTIVVFILKDVKDDYSIVLLEVQLILEYFKDLVLKRTANRCFAHERY